MGKKLLTENEVKNELGVADFGLLQKRKIKKLPKIIPKVDPELAKKIINLFPEYEKMSKSLINNLVEVCNNSLKHNNETTKEIIKGYIKILETDQKQLETSDLTIEMRNRINDDMILVANKLEEIDIRNKEFHAGTIKTVAGTIGVIVGGVLVFLGLRDKK